MGLCFNLNGTRLTLSDEILKSESSVNFWKEVLKNQSNREPYGRFLRILAKKKDSACCQGVCNIEGDSVFIEAHEGESLYKLKREVGPAARYYCDVTNQDIR